MTVDDVAGGALAAQHLIDTGRSRLLFVGGPVAIQQVSDRLAGARSVVDQYPGVTLEEVFGDALTVLEGRRLGQTIADRAPGDWPDAVFAANDLLAIGLLQSLFIDGRLAVPGEIALVGYDDILFAGASVVPLTSIRQPSHLIGETAVRILLEEADDRSLEPRHIRYQPELVVRESTTPR